MIRERIERLPPLVAAISLVGDTARETATNIRQLERPPPNLYECANQFFWTALRGGLSVDAVITQATKLPVVEAKRRTLAILSLCKDFLTENSPCRVVEYSNLEFRFADDLKLEVRPLHLASGKSEDILIVTTFWERPLSDRHQRAVVEVMRRTAARFAPRLAAANLQWVTAAIPPWGQKRHLSVVNWDTYPSMDDGDLARFFAPLLEGWALYQSEFKPEQVR